MPNDEYIMHINDGDEGGVGDGSAVGVAFFVCAPSIVHADDVLMLNCC